MDKQIKIISNQLLKISNYFDKIPTGVLIFGCLAMCFFSIQLNSNEEQYMQLAKQFVNSDWIYKSQNLTEVAGTRIIYQIIIGNTLNFLSFELTKLIYSLILIIGFSLCLTKIYRVLSLNNYHFLIHLWLFIFFDQSFFAGSWMLVSVEPKGFAYLFVLIAFYYNFTKKLNTATIFLLIATYFHVLVGFYSFAYLFLTLFIFRKYHQIKLGKLIGNATLYSVLIIPFLIYLKTTALDNSIGSNEVPASWIYTYYRAPHHTALFKSLKYFIGTHLSGVLRALIGLLITIIMYPLVEKERNIRLLNQFVIVSLAGTLLLVFVAFFDSNGQILKFYLYRINTLSTFFLMLLIAFWIFHLTTHLKVVRLITFLIFSSILFKPIFHNLRKNYSYSENQKSINSLADFIKLNTDSKSLFFSYEEDLSLLRKSERNFFVVYKYIPAQMSKIHNWYNRIQEKRTAKDDPSKIKEIINSYGVEYIIIPSDKKNWLDFKLIYENNDFLLLETGVKTTYNKE